MNSFKHVRLALEYEIERQKGILDEGGESYRRRGSGIPIKGLRFL